MNLFMPGMYLLHEMNWLPIESKLTENTDGMQNGK